MVNIYMRLKYGSFVMILLPLLAFLLPETSAVDANCNYEQHMTPAVTYYVYNPEYPKNYGPSKNCRWVATAPVGYQIDITCQLEMPSSMSCSQDRLMISLTGNQDLQNSNIYCGYGNISLQTEGNSITLGLITPYNTPGGRFLCTMQSTEILQHICDCGWKQAGRIVGGVETKVNEFPMMAALINLNIEDQICGATIIASRYAISVAHCFKGLATTIVGLLVGDHNIFTGADTNAAKIYNIMQVIIHPEFNPNKIESGHDIAIVKTVLFIEFSQAVGLACLPIRYYRDSFANQTVEVLGWGTTEYTGPKSEVLLKTNLTVLSLQDCYNSVYGNAEQMCTYTPGHDSCQSDSGGPLLWHNDQHKRLYLVGMVSTGIGCGEPKPGVNTRITSFLLWIMANTIDADYCVK